MDTNDCDVPIEIDVYELFWRARVRLHLPETIVYKFGRLEHWFFCSATKSGEPPKIKRKRDYTVRRGDVVEKILDAFCAHATHDEQLVATWVSGMPGENCRVLHLTRRTLSQFLAFMKHAQKGHGLLQRWCEPFGGHSTMLRTDWSPHHFALEMSTNWHSVRASPPRRASAPCHTPRHASRRGQAVRVLPSFSDRAVAAPLVLPPSGERLSAAARLAAGDGGRAVPARDGDDGRQPEPPREGRAAQRRHRAARQPAAAGRKGLAAAVPLVTIS